MFRVLAVAGGPDDWGMVGPAAACGGRGPGGHCSLGCCPSLRSFGPLFCPAPIFGWRRRRSPGTVLIVLPAGFLYVSVNGPPVPSRREESGFGGGFRHRFSCGPSAWRWGLVVRRRRGPGVVGPLAEAGPVDGLDWVRVPGSGGHVRVGEGCGDVAAVLDQHGPVRPCPSGAYAGVSGSRLRCLSPVRLRWWYGPIRVKSWRQVLRGRPRVTSGFPCLGV